MAFSSQMIMIPWSPDHTHDPLMIYKLLILGQGIRGSFFWTRAPELFRGSFVLLSRLEGHGLSAHALLFEARFSSLALNRFTASAPAVSA